MESRAQKRSLPGFGGDLDEGRASEQPGAREDRIRLLNEIASEGIKVLKRTKHHLPDTVEGLTPATRKQLGELMQRYLAEWRKSKEANDVG